MADLDNLLTGLKAAAEVTRLRLLALFTKAELGKCRLHLGRLRTMSL